MLETIRTSLHIFCVVHSQVTFLQCLTHDPICSHFQPWPSPQQRASLRLLVSHSNICLVISSTQALSWNKLFIFDILPFTFLFHIIYHRANKSYSSHLKCKFFLRNPHGVERPWTLETIQLECASQLFLSERPKASNNFSEPQYPLLANRIIIPVLWDFMQLNLVYVKNPAHHKCSINVSFIPISHVLDVVFSVLAGKH